MAHRDYTSNASVQVMLFRDRLEKRRTPKKIGEERELRVAGILAQLPEDYAVFYDVVLRSGDRTTQINRTLLQIHQLLGQ